MKATVYKGFGYAKEVIDIEAGKPLSETVEGLDLSSCAVVANARLVGADYVPEEGDGVLIRELPKAPVVAIVISIVTAVVAIAAGVVAGVVAYKQKKELERQKEEMEKLKGSTNSETATNLPYLRGASNTLATGKSQPYMMGRNFFTPYLLTDRWYELEGVDGARQYVTGAYECGFGKQAFERVQADDVPLKTWDWRDGPQEGAFDMIDDSGSTGFSAGGRLEIAQDGARFSDLTQVNARVASESVQTEIPYKSETDAGAKASLVCTLDPNAMNVRLAISFPSGLYAMNSLTGGKVETTANVRPYYSLDGGSTWTEFSFRQANISGYGEDRTDIVGVFDYIWNANVQIDYYIANGYLLVSRDDTQRIGPFIGTLAFLAKRIQNNPIYAWSDSNSFTRNTINEIRFEAAKEFSWADYSALSANGQKQIMIKVVNDSANDSNTRNSACLLYYESQCFEPEKSKAPAGALTAEQYAAAFPSGSGLEASEIVSAKVRSLSAVMAVRMRATASNAAKAAKINFTSRSLARTWSADSERWSGTKSITNNPAALMLEVLTSPTHPMSRLADSEIDLDSFGALYEFCEAEGMTFNAVQSQTAMKAKVLEQICATCRASVYWNAEGKLAVAYDAPQEAAVANLTDDSLIEVSVEKELARPIDALRLTYLDENTWTQQTITVLNNGVAALDENSVIRDLSVTGITERTQAVKYARYTMSCYNVRQKTVSVRVGNEGICFAPCSLITVKDDALGDTPQSLLIASASSDGTGWTLKCVDYSEDIYNPGTIASYESKILQLGRGSTGLPSGYATQGALDSLKSDLATGTANFGRPDTPTMTACKARRDAVELSCSPLGAGQRNELGRVAWQVAKVSEPQEADWTTFATTDSLKASYVYDRAADGYPEASGFANWLFRAKAVNAFGAQSEWSPASSVDTSEYGTWIVGEPDEVSHRVSGRTAMLAFDQAQRGDGKEVYGDVYYKIEIRKSDGTNWYNPADDEDPYESEDNWKDGGAEASPSSDERTAVTQEYLLAGKSTTHAFTQTLPLEGQNDMMFQEEWFYEVPASDAAHRRLDSYGNPCKEGKGVRWTATNPSTDWDAQTHVYGDQDEDEVYGYFDGDGEPWVHGALGMQGSETSAATVMRYDQDIYEFVPDAEETGWESVFFNGENYAINGSQFAIDGRTFTINGDGTVSYGAETYDMFTAEKTLAYGSVTGFNPTDTVYVYKVRAYNKDGPSVVNWSGAKTIVVNAFATSVKDIVEGAVTHNKLSPGCVWMENLAAGSITADKMAVKDLYAITGVFGKIQNNKLQSSSYNFWDLESGRFHVGNEASIDPGTGETSNSDEAEFIDFNPSTGTLAMKIANFIVKAVSSIIQGAFVLRNKSTSRKNLFVGNPMARALVATGDNPEVENESSDVPALTARFNGNVELKESVLSDGGNSAYAAGNLTAEGGVTGRWGSFGRIVPKFLSGSTIDIAGYRTAKVVFVGGGATTEAGEQYLTRVYGMYIISGNASVLNGGDSYVQTIFEDTSVVSHSTVTLTGNYPYTAIRFTAAQPLATLCATVQAFG